MLNVLPRPQNVKILQGEGFSLSPRPFFVCDKQLIEASQLLCENVKKILDVELREQDGGIQIRFNAKREEGHYALTIDTQGVVISAGSISGALYGVQTLTQLLCGEVQGVAPCCVIDDYPRYAYRGLSLDIVRHFFPLSEIKVIIDVIANLKFNVLHLHLSDDQGWRIESQRYPLLNQISSYRDATLIRRGGNRYERKRYGGYLTKQEVRELIQYAAARGINVLPEIDLPGHMVALLAAYPQLSCRGEQLSVRTRWGISQDILCVGNSVTYELLEGVLDEICELFPFPYIHLGGDEAPKQRWKKCPKCQALMKQLGLTNEQQLQAHFFNHFAVFLREKGKQVIGWNECLNDTLDDDVIIQHWTGAAWGRHNASVDALNNGRKMVISNFNYTYFDYPYAMTPLAKAYSFNPVFEGVNDDKINNIWGVECNLWAEHIRDVYKLQFNLFPRVQAFSEVAWGVNDNYDEFVGRLNGYYSLLDKFGVLYAKGYERKKRSLLGTARFFLCNAHYEVDKQKKTR